MDYQISDSFIKYLRDKERKLTTPIDTVAKFLALVQNILDNNPWGCTSYESDDNTIAGVIRGTEYYSGKVCTRTLRPRQSGRYQMAPTSSAFSTDVSTIIAAPAINIAMGGDSRLMTVQRTHSAVC